MIEKILERVVQAQQQVLLDTVGEFSANEQPFKLVRPNSNHALVFAVQAADDQANQPLIGFHRLAHLADDMAYWKIVTPAGQDSNLSLEGGRWLLYTGLLRTRHPLDTDDLYRAMGKVGKLYIENFGIGVSHQ